MVDFAHYYCLSWLVHLFLRIRAGHRQWKNGATTITDNQQPATDNRHPTTINKQQPQSTVSTQQRQADKANFV